MSDANHKPEGDKVVVVTNTDMELNEEDLAKVAGGMMMSDGGSSAKSKTINGLDTSRPKYDTDVGF
ncbi:MAG: hypothetical protein IPJ48_10635 [Propionivibrio sp.]|uniref:Uncharacterized protein n=1 Tax=Candidatus Propionivibrio dominans TaxID=2954373 RepID=A0A9D7FFU2_9RHOO|nr:hypothetical protein [Candidatus Propionivibrio dominans]MBL0167513.1 hypothetical protein [Propionivibrio sp.]